MACASESVMSGLCASAVWLLVAKSLDRGYGWGKNLGDADGQGHTGTRDLKTVPMVPRSPLLPDKTSCPADTVLDRLVSKP